MAAAKPKNVSSWRLNAADKEELAEAQIGKGSANQQYYQEVKAATQKILAEFPGIEGHSPLPFRLGGEATGVQDPYSKLNGCGPGGAVGSEPAQQPHARRSHVGQRVHDMTTFFYSSGPKFLTDKQVCATSSTDLPDTPSMLQMISLEEIVRAMIFGCAEAIGRHGCKMTVLPS